MSQVQVFKSFSDLAKLVKVSPSVDSSQTNKSKPKTEKRGKGQQKVARTQRERSKEKLKDAPKLSDFSIDEILFERAKLIEIGFDNKKIDSYIEHELSEEPLQAWYDKKEFVDNCVAEKYDETIYRTVRTLELVQKHGSLSLKRLARLIKLWTALDAVTKLASTCVTEKYIMGSPAKIAKQLKVIQARALKSSKDADIENYDRALFINQQDVITDIANLVAYGKTCDYTVSFEEPDDITVRLAERAGRKMAKIPCLLPDATDDNILVILQNIIAQFDRFYEDDGTHTVLPLDGIGYGFMNTHCMLLNNRKLNVTHELAEELLEKINTKKKTNLVILGNKILDTEKRDWIGFWIMQKPLADQMINMGCNPIDLCFPKRAENKC